MALTDKLDLSTDQVFALGDGSDKLQKIEGYYLGNRAVNTANGDSVIHVFKTLKGNVGIWGTAKLNGNLGAGDLGVMQSITYKGKVKIAGGKTQHTYRFQSDSDDTIPVQGLSAGNGQAVEFNDEEEEETFVPSTNRASEVAAMLNKNKKQA